MRVRFTYRPFLRDEAGAGQFLCTPAIWWKWSRPGVALRRAARDVRRGRLTSESAGTDSRTKQLAVTLERAPTRIRGPTSQAPRADVRVALDDGRAALARLRIDAEAERHVPGRGSRRARRAPRG